MIQHALSRYDERQTDQVRLGFAAERGREDQMEAGAAVGGLVVREGVYCAWTSADSATSVVGSSDETVAAAVIKSCPTITQSLKSARASASLGVFVEL